MPEQASHEAGFAFAGQLMFPDAEDAPAEGAEGAGDEAVAGAVAGNFFAPELGILLGLGGVERAAVPEAAVDEDGEAVGPEDEVGFHAEGLQPRPFAFPRSVAPRRQPVMPWARRRARRRSSVAALPRERMADITAERFFRLKRSGIEPSVRRWGALTTHDLWKT